MGRGKAVGEGQSTWAYARWLDCSAEQGVASTHETPLVHQLPPPPPCPARAGGHLPGPRRGRSDVSGEDVWGCDNGLHSAHIAPEPTLDRPSSSAPSGWTWALSPTSAPSVHTSAPTARRSCSRRRGPRRCRRWRRHSSWRCVGGGGGAEDGGGITNGGVCVSSESLLLP